MRCVNHVVACSKKRCRVTTMKLTNVGAICLFSFALCFAAGPARADEAAVRGAIAKYVQAFNDKDVSQIGEIWQPAGTYTDRETGEKVEGRKAFLADITASFKANPKSRLAGSVDSVRFITPAVAQVQGTTVLSKPDSTPARSAYTAILVQRDKSWVIDSIEESALPQPQAPGDALRELEWLVGTWVDNGGDIEVETSFKRSASGAFLLRNYVAKTKGEVLREGTQVIGWDPRAREIRSWSFNSDGSFGDGIWSRSGADWLVKSTQTLADGRAASGTYVLTPQGKDALKMQLIGHAIEGAPQPNRPAVNVVRQPEENTASAAGTDSE